MDSCSTLTHRRGAAPLHRLATFLPGLSLLPLPLDGGFLIVLSPFHLLEEASLHHELLQRLERWLDLIVAHFDFHGSNSLLDASGFGGAKVTWPRRVGGRVVQGADKRIVRREWTGEVTGTV